MRAPTVRAMGAGAAGIVLACVVAACGTSSSTGGGGGRSTTTTASTTTASTTVATSGGTASVAYADSLQLLFSSVLQPGFQTESGDQVQARSGGSTTLAQEILSGEITPGVLVSVGRKAPEKLYASGKAEFVIQLATDPLVVAYNPHGKYASQFAAIASGKQPLSSLFTLLATSGLRLGRTDPDADPQGVYFLLMNELAQKVLNLSYDPASTVLGVSSTQPFGSNSQIVDATALITDLQAGDFDATSAYLTQALQYKLPYITLPASLNFSDPADNASYETVSVTLTDGTVDKGGLISLDVTLVAPPTGNGAPSPADTAADDAFVDYLLSAAGQTALKNGGYTVAAPVFTGATSADTPSTALPATVLNTFQAAGGKAST